MKLNIADSLAEAMRFSIHHAVPFYLLALVVGLPRYLHSFLPQETQRLTLPGGQFHTQVLPRPWWETDLAVPVMQALLLGVMVAIMVHTRRRDRWGEVRSALPNFVDAAPCLPTVIAVSLAIELVSRVITAGSTLLGEFIGPAGFIFMLPLMALLLAFYLVYCVAIPCAAADNAGVLEAFRRSAALTAGSRGRLFGLFVVVFLPLLAVIAAVVWLFRSAIFSGGFPDLGLWLVGAALGVYFSAVIVVLHEALLTLKEGAGGGTLATVFD